MATKKSNKSASKQKKSSKKLIITLALVLILAVGTQQFISRGGRATVRRIYYGYVVKQAYHKQYKNLKPALEGLGLSENKGAKSTCAVQEVATDGVNVSKVLLCGVQTDNFVVITKSNKQTILDAAKQLDNLTAQNGGRMYTNTGPTFSKYFTDMASGVDYNPDFGATFIKGNYLCEVHMNIAFSKPQPPAYSIQFGCNAPRVTKDDLYLSSP